MSEPSVGLSSEQQEEDLWVEARRLRAINRDLISLIALPAIWTGQGPRAIVETLLEVLASMLRVELVYARVASHDGLVEAARAESRSDLASRPAAVGAALEQVLRDGKPGEVVSLETGIVSGVLRCLVTSIGLGRDAVVVIGSSRPGFPTESESLILKVALNQAAIGLQGAKLVAERERAEEQQREERSRLGRIATMLSSELDQEKLVQLLTDEATALCGAKFGAFFYNVFDSNGESYLLYTLSGAPKEAFAHFGLPRATALFGPTFRGEGIVRCDDVTQDSRYGHLPPHHGMPEGHLSVRSYLAVPVRSRSSQVLGGLFFGHSDPGRFTQLHERLVSAVASQAAVALDNSHLYRAMSERARQAAFAASIGAALTGEESLPEQLKRCCEAMVELGAAFAQIWTLDEGEGVLELQASAGLYTHLDGPHARVTVGELKIGRIASERRPHLTNLVVEDPLVDREWALREGMVAFAGYPLLVADRLIGVMALFARQPLSDDILHSLGAIAHQIALAIERDKAERFRELFIGILGHDLRNPLNAIATGAEVLLLTARRSESSGPPANERIEKTLARIKNSTARMARMIDQILDFVRRRVGGGIPIVRAATDLHEICRGTIEEMAAAFPGRKIETQLSGNGGGAWDPDRLAQVFSNLIGNALSYGDPAEPVRVTVEDDRAHVMIEVHNTGPAIAPEVRAKLFDPFRRAQHGKSEGTQGLGIGLYITKQIVAAHGGTVGVRSSAGEGTVFCVRLPRLAGESTESA